jgi:hypothetical protein
MRDLIRKALTRRVTRRGPRGKTEIILVEPNEKLVTLVKLVLGMTLCLCSLEIAHIIFLGRWNSEVFAAISGLSGTAMGIFIGQKT